MYPDDFDVENDNCPPSHFFCSLFWEDPDIDEFHLRRQFRHLVLVTSTGKQNIAVLSFYTAGRGVDNQHKLPSQTFIFHRLRHLCVLCSKAIRMLVILRIFFVFGVV